MPGNLIESVGGSAQKPTRAKPIYTSRFFQGLFSNRNQLRSPMGVLYGDFYKVGATDCLIDGLNTELSTRLTLIRRPGCPAFSPLTISGIADSFYSFHQANGNIQVIVDSSADVQNLSAVGETANITVTFIGYGNVALYEAVNNFSAGQQVTVTGTTNGGGIFNVTDATITSANSTSFTVTIISGLISSAFDTGVATVLQDVIWTKTTGAGEGYFQGVDESLYIGDGIDTVKYIPTTLNALNQFGQSFNNSVWLFSPVAPLVAPTLTITESGSSGVAWVASTFFSTMGFIVDSNSDIEQLVSVNALLNNNTQIGVAGNGQPDWNQSAGGTTTDNSITWTNQGQLSLWLPNTAYQPGQPIYDPTTNTIQSMQHSNTRTSGKVQPNFSSVLFTIISEGGSGTLPRWECLGVVNGSPTCVKTWSASTAFSQYLPASASENPNATNSAVVEPTIPTAALLQAGSVIYLQGATTAGTTASSATSPFPSGNTAGQLTLDNQLGWFNLGPAAWTANTSYTAWPGVNNTFSAVVDTNSPVNFWVCITSGISATGSAAFPTAPTYGTNFVESTGGVAWVCVGPSAHSRWKANADYYLPAVGFSPPTPTNPFGGAVVFDDNSPVDTEFNISSGFSGNAHPTWATVKGNTTVDAAGGGTDVGTTWINGGAFTGLGFSWVTGYGYVYAYKSRAANDPDVTIAPPLATVLANNPNVTGPLGPPTGCQDGSVSTASPVGFFGSPTPAPNAGAIITVQGKYSLDPAIDTIMIFRSADGFQTSGPYLLVTEIANNTALATDPSNTTTGLFSVFDFMADIPSVVENITLPGLNELIVAPIDHINDPVPGQFGSTQFQQATGSVTPNPLNPFPSTAAGTAGIGFTYHQGRLWCFIGNNVFASGGPDTTTGNGFTAWPPTNTFPFQSNVTRIVSTTAGLIVLTTTDLYIIAGGPGITTYYSQLLVPGLGLLSWNALTLVGGTPVIFSSDNQLIQIEPSTGISRIGHPIGNLLSGSVVSAGGLSIQFNPANVYLTHHSSGDQDHALFVCDGEGHWFRCDLNLAPDASITGPVFSPVASINGGNIKAIGSIEVSPGVHKLLIGDSRAGQQVLYRDSTFSVFTDNNVAYDANYTVGGIVLANPGQMARLFFLEFDFVNVGTLPSTYILYDELVTAATQSEFELISNSTINDPPKLYGPTGGGGTQPISVMMPRMYLGQSTPENVGAIPQAAWCKWVNIKVDYGSDTVMNETLSFSIFGDLYQEL